MGHPPDFPQANLCGSLIGEELTVETNRLESDHH